MEKTKSLGSGSVYAKTVGSLDPMELPKREPFIFTWHIEDSSGGPISDCTLVTATLYAGRSASNPDLAPGVPVPSFANCVLVPPTWTMPLPAGDYSLEIGAITPFDPPAGSNYRMVVDAVRGKERIGHWEPAVAVVISK